MKKILENKKLVYSVVGIVVAVAFVVCGVLIYNDSRKELIPDTVAGLVTMHAYTDYLNTTSDVMMDAKRLGTVKDAENPFFKYIMSSSDGLQRKDLLERAQKAKVAIPDFMESYKARKNQDSYRLYQESIEFGELNMQAIDDIEVALDLEMPQSERLAACDRLNTLYNDKLLPLDTKMANRMNDEYDRLVREGVITPEPYSLW